MAKRKAKPVRTLKRHRAINDLGYFWLVLEQLTARFQDENLDREYRFKQEYLNDRCSCYDAWGMLLHLTRAAIERRDPALQRACYDCVEGCLMTPQPEVDPGTFVCGVLGRVDV